MLIGPNLFSIDTNQIEFCPEFMFENSYGTCCSWYLFSVVLVTLLGESSILWAH